MSALRRRCAVLAAALGLAGCALAPVQDAGSDSPPEDCAQALSARGSARPIPGFAGLATQRSLAAALPAPGRGASAQWSAWVARSRALALADGTEFAGQPRMDACSAWHAGRLQDPAVQALLQRAAQVPSDYSLLQRMLGAYPVTAIGLRLGIRGYQAQTLAEWGRVPSGDLRVWSVADTGAMARPQVVASRLRAAPRDALAMPELTPEVITAAVAAFAPRFVIEQASLADQPGAPVAEPLGVDVQQPILSWRLDYTRLQGRWLPQLSWVIWFSGRPADGPLDPYAGALDGVVWRTTFGPDGWPLVHDTIHSCGCYHMVFPARHAAQSAPPGFWHEARLQPRAPLPWSQLSVVLEASTHYVVAVAAGDADLARSAEAALAPQPWVQTRQALQSRMDAMGVIRGSERLERYWLWPSGVRSPGAMRDFGRHATAFIGTQHFDDPDVLGPYVAPLQFTLEP